MRTLSMLMSQREDKLEQRFDRPKDNNEEDWLSYQPLLPLDKLVIAHDKFKHAKDPFMKSGPFV